MILDHYVKIMMDDKDRQVCDQVKKQVLDGLEKFDGIWKIDTVTHSDPGSTIKLVAYKGEAQETYAYVEISYWKLDPKSRS